MDAITTLGTGHNRGPSTEGAGFRVHFWRVARAELLGPRLPVEVVRQQVRRAQALGLDYKTYAGVRATTGRDLVAFLYSSNALGVFRDGQRVVAPIAARIAASAAAPHLGTGPRVAAALAAQIGAVSAMPLPPFGTPWAAMRDDLKTWLRDRRLLGDAVLMIGETDHEREIMAAAGIAGFIPGQTFFNGQTHAI